MKKFPATLRARRDFFSLRNIRRVINLNGKIEFDKNIDAKDFKAISSHGSHRSHSSG
ncbi:MAG: hypothetical protein SR1Q7_05480 [Quinella sp. 1Q7]|nr:hypothetical protein [Quinella sp. 1Q7]